MLIAKAKGQSFAAARARRIDSKGNALEVGIMRWLQRYAELRMKDVTRALDAGGVAELKRRFAKPMQPVALSKAAPKDILLMEKELQQLLIKFGLVQFKTAGKAAARLANQNWKLTPKHAEIAAADAAEKVVLLVESTELQVRDSINRLVRQALSTTPRPTVRELGRQIARTWMGPASDRAMIRGTDEERRVTADWRRSQKEIDAGGREHIFSFGRAQVIARTELSKAENKGIAQAYEDIGIDSVRWVAFGDGRSGERHHERMNRHRPITVKAMQGKDPSKWFKLPNGERAPYPNAPGMTAFNAVNCRCTIVPG